MFKVAHKTRSERPGHYITTHEVFVFLLSAWSTHANFGIDLVANMVVCHRKHDLLYYGSRFAERTRPAL